jgi:hypothetical protein
MPLLELIIRNIVRYLNANPLPTYFTLFITLQAGDMSGGSVTA